MSIHNFRFSFPVLFFFLSLSRVVFADVSDNDAGWSISLGIGVGVRTNPVMDNGSIPLIIIPQINYQGERFFIQNLDIGYSLVNNEQHQFNFLLTPSYDQVFFNRWDANNFVAGTQSLVSVKTDYPALENSDRIINKKNLHERHMAALAGFEYLSSYQTIDFQIQGLHEITHYYSGDEIRIAISKNITAGKNDIKLTMGANWQSQKTLAYFYGLTEEERSSHILYEPESGITTLLRFDWNYQLSSTWSLRFFGSYRHLSDSITQSPLITKNNVITVFAGGVYHF